MIAIPFLGAGIGYRWQLREELLKSTDGPDVLEVVAERYLRMPSAMDELLALRERWPIVVHGVSLSIASDGCVDREMLHRMRRLCEVTGSPYYSEHLALTQVPGIDIGHLSPPWYTDATFKLIVQNIQRVQETIERPLVLENITYSHQIPGATTDQEEFLSALVAQTGCGILLDVTNLHINSVNHGFDPHRFLDRLPLDAIVHVHLAGGHEDNGHLVDSHAHAVDETSFSLLQTLARRATVRVAIIERDQNIPRLPDLMGQVARVRNVLASCERVSRGAP